MAKLPELCCPFCHDAGWVYLTHVLGTFRFTVLAPCFWCNEHQRIPKSKAAPRVVYKGEYRG